MYKVLELMPVNAQDGNFCHDQQIEWFEQIDLTKQID
jgi:hypothetical protein